MACNKHVIEVGKRLDAKKKKNNITGLNAASINLGEINCCSLIMAVAHSFQLLRGSTTAPSTLTLWLSNLAFRECAARAVVRLRFNVNWSCALHVNTKRSPSLSLSSYAFNTDITLKNANYKRWPQNSIPSCPAKRCGANPSSRFGFKLQIRTQSHTHTRTLTHFGCGEEANRFLFCFWKLFFSFGVRMKNDHIRLECWTKLTTHTHTRTP